jgi:pilus assembly protein FimV
LSPYLLDVIVISDFRRGAALFGARETTEAADAERHLDDRVLGDALKRTSLYTGRFALTGVAAAALCLTVPDASALGLGRLAVQSALGESLRAEIDITSLTPEEAANLRVRIAPPEAYRTAGVDYNAVLPGTTATLMKRPDGRPYLRLTSDRAVQEPFVDVILEISWATGRLVREYTLLFDPPITARAAPQSPAPAPAPMAQAPAFNPPIMSQAPAAPPAQARAERRAAAKAAADAAAPPEPRTASRPAGVEADDYRVRSGDSLSRVAAKTQRPGVSLDQMLVALFRANPSAFIDNNMNRLKAGVVLSVPTADAAQAVPAPQARQVIMAQSADFGAYRQRLAGAEVPAKTEGTARQASGKVQASVDDRKQAAAPAPDKLTLSKGSAAGIATAQDDKLSKDREKAASAARVAELSKNVDQLKKLSGAASAPPVAGAAPAVAPAASVMAARPSTTVIAPTPAVVPPPVVVAQAPASAVVARPVPAPVPAAPVVAPPMAPAAVVAALPASAVARAPASAVVAAKPPVRPTAAAKPPVEEPGPLGALLDENPLVLGLGALAVALLAAFGIYRYTKRSKKDSGETSFLESRLQPDSFFGASGGQRIDTRDAGGSSSSMTYSLSQLDAIGDVDPVAEADVYLAYGRDLQAEEILKEAMRSSPERLAIRTKLLEVYAKRRDTKGFELLATQLFALTRGEGEDWAKAQELGAEIDPDNPLFQPGGAPTEAVRVDAPEPLGASTLPQSVVPVPSHFGHSLPAEAVTDSAFSELDLDLDNPEIGHPTAPGALDTTQAFPPESGDDNYQATTHKMPLVPNESQPEKKDEPLAFDMSGFSIDLDKPASVTTEPAPVATAAAGGDIDIPFGADDDGQDPMVRKLELAEEFRQIGDKDGARDLLREVLAKASGATKSKARGMLDDLG